MTKIRIANGSLPWVSGHITIDYAGKTANGKPYVLFHVFARNKRIARFQIKGSQIYELVNAIVDAAESVTVPSSGG